MLPKHREKRLLPRPDPELCCVACGECVPVYSGDVGEEREDWKKLVERKNLRTVVVPSAEVEVTDFKETPELWGSYYRTILDDPKTKDICVSGICPGVFLDPMPGPVPRDPQRARLFGYVDHANRWNVEFRMVNMLGRHWNRAAGQRIGYPIHAHCWVLVGRVVGHELVQKNLCSFVRAVERYWRANRTGWGGFMLHFTAKDNSCYERGMHWLNRGEEVRLGGGHMSKSPLRILEIQELIARVTSTPSDDSRSRCCQNRPGFTALLVEIKVMIVDCIYHSQSHCQGRIEDTRNMLEAFGWQLPRTYWWKRCNPELVFEANDLLKRTDIVVDWVEFCLGLEGLLLDDDWYCASGLNNRKRILKVLRGIKDRFVV